MELKAKVIKLENMKSNAGNAIQEVTVEWNEPMKNGSSILKHFCLTAFGEKVTSFGLNVGDEATFFIDINAREYKGRWYNSATIWRVDKPAQPAQPSAPAPQQQADTEW